MVKDIFEIYLKKTGQTFQEIMGGAMGFGINAIIKIIREEALPQNKKIIWYYANKHDLQCDSVSYRLEPINESETRIFAFCVEGGGAEVYRLADNAIVERGQSVGILDEEEDPAINWEKYFADWEAWWKHFEIDHKENWIYIFPIFIHDEIKTFVKEKTISYKPKSKATKKAIEYWERSFTK